ncbi:MAG: biotin attachment protein [Fibrobacterales bacterium]
MKKLRFMDTSFRDGFQSVYGARVLTEDFMPAVEAARKAGITHFEAGGGARFQSLFFYCNESAFDMMDEFRKVAGPDAELQTLARGINVVALSQCPRDIIDLHAKMFKKHGMSTIRNFDALNDVNNLVYSGERIKEAGLNHQIVVSMMDLPPGCEGAHTSDFYMDRLRQILDSGVPFDSICFKDASGTANPKKIYETFKGARKLLGDDALLWLHTHDTAGVATTCYMAAIEAAATKDNNLGIDMCKSPVSGGTAQPDILSMWHVLKGTEWDLGIDPFEILKASDAFEQCMKDYYVPREAKQVSPVIPLSPMPGGALTANTMMMRDTNTLHLYPEVIREMSDVVRKGGFGTSVTPVSQFYFQQAFANVTQGKWNKITDGYGNMVLGYFGKTPTAPDSEIVKIASEQLGKPVFTGDPLDVLEPGIPQATKTLQENGLEVTDENIFIAYACKDKGIEYLKGNMTANVRKNEPEKSTTQGSGDGNYTITVNGKAHSVAVAGENITVDGKAFDIAVAEGGVSPVAKTSSGGAGEPIVAAMPGTVVSIEVSEGDQVSEGDELLIVEAMKMESPVKSTKSGIVTSIEVTVGDNVQNGDTLVIIE